MTILVRLRLACLGFTLFALTATFSQSVSDQSSALTPASLETRRQQLLSLFDEEWQYELRTNPELATMLGDNRYNDRLSDNSAEFFQSDIDWSA